MRSAILTCLLLVTVFFTGHAQKMEGEVTYEKVYHWARIYSRLTFLSAEEKDRMKMTWGKDDESKQDMKLFFNPQRSYYTYSKTQESNESGYSWTDKEYKIYRDLENEKRTDIVEMLGRIYIVEDSVRAPKWKVMNKIKEINGYMCMMAVTEDTIRSQQITAWFADNIPVSIGPDMYGGLPGMILELDINEGDIVITAKKIEMKPVTEDLNLPKKLKGRKITEAEYNSLMAAHIRDSIKAHRSPFGAIPF